MLELSNIATHIIDDTDKSVIIIFKDGERISSFMGKCEDITIEHSFKLIKFKTFGVYDNVIHSLETEDMYRKLNSISKNFVYLDPRKGHKYYNTCISIINECLDKKNYGFKASFLPDSELLFSICMDNRHYSLKGKIDYVMKLDDSNTLCCDLISTIPFLSNILDDIYIDFSSSLSDEDSIDSLQLITEGLIKQFKFKFMDSYNF